MIDRRIKAIITLLLCISLATAQQISNTRTLKAKNKIEFQIALKKWQEKLKQFNTPNLIKSQQYAELRQEMWKELRDIMLGKTTAPVQQYKPSLTAVSTKVTEAATCYDVPFASKGNTIDLAVANTSVLAAEGVKVEVTNTPEWLKFTEKDITLTTLKANEEQTASFTFSVNKSAKVNKEDTLRFTITDKTGQTWTKEIKISITPPTTYELYQNYPNPFNPTTTIEYQLPGTGTRLNVSLKIYDAIGREITNLVNEQQAPGYYQKTFDASRYASGMYIYRLVATDEQNKQHVFQKKMVLLR
ncbi:MAG: T9SS type A sorting domain-containing protein [Bacteroidota bacterium]